MNIPSKVLKAHLWQRDELDWYVEPIAATRALLGVERFIGAVEDPCCGQGNIIRGLCEAGYQARGSDIKDRVGDPSPGWWLGEIDFLKEAPGPTARNAVFNPPFFRGKGAEDFIRKALHVYRGKICAFLDIRFLAGAGRAEGLFKDHAPARIWMITPRPSCPPGDYLAAGNKASGGSADWCWAVWDWSAPLSDTRFGWLRRGA